MAGSEAHEGSRVLRVQGPSRLAFAGTTLALVTLASLATAALVNESASVAPGTSAPGLQALPPLVSGGGDAVVVERAPGTFLLAPPRATVAPAVRTVVDALTGGAQGSGPTPTVVPRAGGFPVTGVLGGTPVAAPVAVVPVPTPVTAPVVAPPVALPHVPSVPPAKLVVATARAAVRAARAAARAAAKADRPSDRPAHGHDGSGHGKKPEHTEADGTSSTEQDAIEERRFREQAKHAKHRR